MARRRSVRFLGRSARTARWHARCLLFFNARTSEPSRILMVTGEKLEEPRIQPAPLGPEKRFNDGLERIASVLTSVVASLLLVFVVVAIVGVVLDAWNALYADRKPMNAALSGLDAAFIVIILLELVHTTLSRGPISTQVQEFLVIGITSAVRNGLETAAGRSHGGPRETAIDLAITSGAALLLVMALWLIRERLKAELPSSSPQPQPSPQRPRPRLRGERTGDHDEDVEAHDSHPTGPRPAT